MSIRRFFIIANRGKDQDQVFSGKIRDYLNNKGMTCHIVHLEEERIRLRKELNSTTDCLLVLGGDGTVLEAAHIGADTGTPILGINLGNLGYLAEIDSQNWEQALVRILNGDYEVESRMMLDGSVSNTLSTILSSPGAPVFRFCSSMSTSTGSSSTAIMPTA